MAGKQKRGRDTANRILDTALAIYSETGLTQIPVALLSGRSGVTVGSIYHHFTNMDGVAAALYSRCMAGLLDAILTSITRRVAPQQLIAAFVKSYLAWTTNNWDAARFIHASSFEPYLKQFAKEIQASKETLLEGITTVILAQVKAGHFIRMPVFMYEMLLVGPVAETARRWLDGDRSVDIAEAARLLPPRILQSIVVTTGRKGN